MKLTADHAEGNTIKSYQPGQILVQETPILTNIIVSHDTLITDWEPPEVAALGIADFEPVLALEPEIILFGTGDTQSFPDISLITTILKRGTAFEVMDTNAACRTYNVLVGEYRKVVAALLV